MGPRFARHAGLDKLSKDGPRVDDALTSALCVTLYLGVVVALMSTLRLHDAHPPKLCDPPASTWFPGTEWAPCSYKQATLREQLTR